MKYSDLSQKEMDKIATQQREGDLTNCWLAIPRLLEVIKYKNDQIDQLHKELNETSQEIGTLYLDS